MKIRGKEYMEVKDRVMVFRKNHPSWALITEIIENNEATGSVIFKVVIEDENGRVRGTGHAHEFKEDKTSMVNKTSHLENCETSAIGRALASIGIGIESSYATYDEVKIAIDKGERAEKSRDDIFEQTEPRIELKTWRDAILEVGQHKGKKLGDVPIDYITFLVGHAEAGKIKNSDLEKAVNEAGKELNGNGKQGFEQVG